MIKSILIVPILIVLVTGCGQSKVERKIAEFQDLKSKVEAGDLVWVRANAPSVMSLVLCPNSKDLRGRPDPMCGWDKPNKVTNYFEVADYRNKIASELIELYATTKVAEVKESIVEALKSYPAFSNEDAGTLKPNFFLEVALSTQMEILQRIGQENTQRIGSIEIRQQYYNLRDREFVRDELCRAVDEEEFGYTVLLISVSDFDVGVLRCRETGGVSWGDYTSYRGVGSCPMSLRRIAGKNYGSTVAARVSSFKRNLAANDWQGMESISEISDAFKGATYTGVSLDGVNSMIDLLDKYNKWGAGGECTTDDLYEGEGGIPKGF